MDGERKKLVCPECGCENIYVTSVLEKQKTISTPWALTTILCFIIIISEFIYYKNNSVFFTDTSNIIGILFLIVIPTIVFIISIAVNYIKWNMLKSEIRVICLNCKKHLNFHLDF